MHNKNSLGPRKCAARGENEKEEIFHPRKKVQLREEAEGKNENAGKL